MPVETPLPPAWSTEDASSLWYRDTISCLQATLAMVLLHAGEDPLPVLGLAWEFLHRPGDVRTEEFYYPCRFDGDPARSLAPYHALRSRWWSPANEDEPLRALEAVLENGPQIVAVDNYHLPFRPAFGDVHAAHLLVVRRVDRRTGLVHVADAMPPAFSGPLRVEALLRGWSSANPRDPQDAFFSDARISRRCLAVEFDTPFPPLDAARLQRALLGNLERFGAADDPAGWGGLSGLRRYTDDVLVRAAAGERRVLEELYTFGWGMQAQASLHGELLRVCGSAWDKPALLEAGRAVERVAHTWTGLRMTAGHGRADPVTVADDLARHAGRLRRRHEEALEALSCAAAAM